MGGADRPRTALRGALAALGTALLGVFAVLGVAATALHLLLASPVGRGWLTPRLVAAVDDAIQGRLELEGFSFERGGLAVRRVRLLDPDGEVVLAAERAFAAADLTRLRARRVGLRLEVERPTVLLARDEEGRLGLARALAPARRSPREEEPGGPSRWTVQVTRLAIRGGALRVERADGAAPLALDGLELDLAGEHGPAGSRVALRARGALHEPVDRPLALEAAATLRQGALAVSLLRARVGETALDGVGEWDLATARGRAALLSVAVSEDGLREALPRSPLAADLAGALYAESDGVVATAGLTARPAAPGPQADARLDAGVALRLAAPLAAGVDLAAHRLDPARLLSGAPPGELTFAARGRILGTEPRTLVAALDLALEPSRLRGGRAGPATARARMAGGAVVVEELRGRLPGARVEARGRWSLAGEISGSARVEASDLAAALANAAGFAGRPLPDLRGAATVRAEGMGTVREPGVTFRLDAPRLSGFGVEARGLALRGEAARPRSGAGLRVAGSAASVVAAGRTARDLSLSASLAGREARAEVTGLVREFGQEPVTLGARGTLTEARDALDLADLVVGWPGTRFALARPARILLDGPRVDRLELAADDQRLALEGGLGEARRGRRRVRTVDARAELARVDVTRLPRGLLPEALGLAGVVTASARAEGELAAPRLEARAEVEGGAALGLAGLALAAEGTLDGPARRARLEASVRRAAGGEARLSAEVPSALRGAPGAERLAVSLTARALPVDELLRLARVEAPLRGFADADLAVTGTVGAPAVTARAELLDARWGAVGPFAARAAVEAPGKEAQVEASLDYLGSRAVNLDGEVPLDAAELLHAPARALARLPGAPVAARVSVPGFDLAKLAGLAGLPADLRGALAGDGALRGTARAPRGEVGLDATELAAAGWAGGALRAVIALGDGVTAVRATAALGGEEVLELAATLEAAPESLADLAAAQRAPLDLEVIVPGADLGRVGVRTPLAGSVKGRLHAWGSLAEPRVDLSLRGERLLVSGRPLGDLDVAGQARPSRITVEARLAAAHGGVLTAEGAVEAGLGLEGLRGGALREAPARARLVADRVDLGFLAAALPGTVRTAGGELGADLVAEGPLAKLRPQGTVRVSGGRIAVAEMGEWTGIEIDGALAEDTLSLRRLEARRGRGRLEGRAEATGLALRAGPGQLTASLRARGLAIPRAGQDIVTLEDVEAEAKGTFDAQALRLEVRVPRATVRLPRRSPRELQSLERRDDIVVGEPRRKARKHGEEGAAEEAPYRVVVHAIVPNRFFVRSENPRLDMELKADATFDVIGSRVYSEGDVQVIRGEVEPIGGRRFDVERGKVTFTGGEPRDAVLDVVARYENPAAKVTVTVAGTASSPTVKMTSEPPMDEAQIAMLIATGRTELKAGSGGVGTLTGEEAGRAALGAVATQVFKDLIADKLPLDSVALDSSQIRAGKYLTDKIYVGYTRSFEAVIEDGENQNEVRVEYQISPRWTFESRYGDGKSGGASLIWSKDY